MTALWLLLLALDAGAALDAGEVSAAPRRVVTLMPLVAGGTVTTKQAKGVSAQLRSAVDVLAHESALRLLAPTKDDDSALRKCGDDAACWGDVAQGRGADLLVTGTVSVADGGLVIRAQVLPAGQGYTAVLRGTDDDSDALDRLARELVAPDTLRGDLLVEGQPGDEVTLDGRRRGTLGQAGSIDDHSLALGKLLEGEHALLVTRPTSKNGVAYEPFTRTVTVRHRQQTALKVTLLPKESTEQLGTDASSSSSLAPVLTVGAGVVMVGGGVACGVLSLLDSLAVEERAERQQLVFPRDQELVARGGTLALVANVFYGAGALTVGAGAAWWVLGASTSTEAP